MHREPDNFDHARCPVCGVPWNDHDESCPRHAFRYVHECRGFGRAGIARCCDLAGFKNPTHPCGCGCHETAAATAALALAAAHVNGEGGAP